MTYVDNPNESKKRRIDGPLTELSSAISMPMVDLKTESTNEFINAIRVHPFHDDVHSIVSFNESTIIRDGKNNIIAVLIRQGLPLFAAEKAANVLRPAAIRSTLRANIFGGEAPFSGIAGYFDYKGSPIELKCRKTAFTYEHLDQWPDIFPMIDYISALYKKIIPKAFSIQNAAIPDLIRIHHSPFSTLTINQRFRTASHTDAGDFDSGYGCLTILEGNFKGLRLTLDNFFSNITLHIGDVLIFNTHHFHSNTEPEINKEGDDWSRLACVFYYRAVLGDPFCMQEYKKRFNMAKELGTLPPTVSDSLIIEKNNGENLNRPAEVFPVNWTPFLAASCMARFFTIKKKLMRLHEIFLNPTYHWEELLFGEPFRTEHGLPLRELKEQIPVVSLSRGRKNNTSNDEELSIKKIHLDENTSKEMYLDGNYLSLSLGEELWNIWKMARARWLELVANDWHHLKKRNPNRIYFTWANQSTMNAAFFDLCEVGKQVLLDLLEKELPSKAEEQSFWSIFAHHLANACVEELEMPKEAMSIEKLNVKIKDFHFGGTRYFKDMPPEEQERRLARRRFLEESRKFGRTNSTSSKKSAGPSTWLTNDTFDYQTEDKEVDYIANEWPLPDDNADEKTAIFHPSADPSSQAIQEDGNSGTWPLLSILVVFPIPIKKEEDLKEHPLKELNSMEMKETWRLLNNPAAQSILGGNPSSLPANWATEDVQVTFAYDSETLRLAADHFDVVILLHVLSSFEPDDKARKVTQSYQRKADVLFIAETDRLCRQYYTLNENIRQAYDSVCLRCFQTLHFKKYGIPNTRVRSRNELMQLVGNGGAVYKLQGSPLNTILIIC